MAKSRLKFKENKGVQNQNKQNVPTWRDPKSFCDLEGLEEDDMHRFGFLKVIKNYSRGSIVFVEGQAGSGVYILCSGRIKLSSCSVEGKTTILGIAKAGDVLGLSAVLSDTEYGQTAEVIESCQVYYVTNHNFIALLKQNTDACLSAAKQLSRSYNAANKTICTLGRAESVRLKLARLFLSWSTTGQGGNGSLQMKNLFTHEEIAEMIGTSRETVTRALRDMRERGLVTLKGSDLIIHNQDRLRLTSGLSRRPEYRL